MSIELFDIDPRNKLGGDVQWEDGDDFSNFVGALNSGAVVRPDGVAGASELPRENTMDALALAELRAVFASYR